MATPIPRETKCRKMALLIGNDAYSDTKNRTQCSVKNVNELGQVLKTIGFNVQIKHDLNREDMINCIIDFSKTINDGDLTFFYYCGHGCSVNNENYLIPIDDLRIKRDQDFEDFTVNLKRTVVERLSERNASNATVCVFDCCYQYSLNTKSNNNASTQKTGLQRMGTISNAFIQLACGANQSANSDLFTKHLLKNIAQENINVAEMFKKIENDVYEESKNKQKPMSMNGLNQSRKIYLNEVVVDPYRLIDVDWDEAKEGSLKQAKEEQTTLRMYYDNFPDIDDAANKKPQNVRKAEELTKSILSKPPSGDVDDRGTACHVIAGLFKGQSQDCLFFDSKDGEKLHDATQNLADVNSDDRPLVLKLSSSEGLGNSKSPKTEHGNIRLIHQLTNDLENNQSNPVLDDIIHRLSRAHGVNKPDICVKSVYVGSFNVVYTVRNLAKRAIDSLMKAAEKLKEQFKQFIAAKIHPLLFRPSFDISYFHKNGNKTFSEKGTFQVGPPGKTVTYTQPTGWTRYGLNVLGKYEDGDYWLEPFNDRRNWYRAFHGTGNASAKDFGLESVDDQCASIDAVANIYKTGFRAARKAAYGPGVYCSPNPAFPEHGYVKTVQLDTEQGPKQFKCMLQVAVNPASVEFTTDKDIWVVPDPKDIRPYGVLIKEV